MTRKVGIIGLGHVGAAIAHSLSAQGAVDEFVFIDIDEAKVTAEALDFEDAKANLEYNANYVVNDWDALADADVVISSVGKISLQGTSVTKDRFVELQYTKYQIKGVSEKLVASEFNGVLVVITNPVDVITTMYQHFTGFPAERVIGTGTLLDTARLHRAVGQALQVHPKSVYGYNVGEHGNSQFTAWSTVTVKDQPITAYGLPLSKLDEAVRAGGFTVYDGKKFTSYGIASAASRLTKAVLTDSYEELPVSNYRSEYGVYVSYPVIVGRGGIVDSVQLHLSADEQAKLDASAKLIHDRYEAVIAELDNE
ncbi:L-lactate dehydrogenase [Weissella hellenica]|uniref:L-lactate dehydrogenase n=1 Tax=Weissella hellenica TaxID=46256 RepID=A0A4Y4G0Z8_WEIHE|nr:L-lactate dehydrogenase [Weissella hellenica]NKY66389.1 L-lactate dehydrogenase [Weissella hellenica]GED35487.1 L-lactate dehydrogenase [Weissella hellenica]SCB72546.1 L-lactate dehydrogenase [Weissella hellenica]